MNCKTILTLLIIGLIPEFVWSQAIEITGKTMGPIEYKILVDPIPVELNPQELADLVQEKLDRVNQTMSTYIADSDVSRFNRTLEVEWISVSTETVAVVARALEISQQTDGAFDITVGPVVDLWKFGKDKSDFIVPSSSQIESVQELVGYEKLEVRMEPPAIKKANPKLRIDLSAIAKGYAVDQVAELLDSLGVENCMVVVGGEVRTSGTKSDGSTWQIGIERPDANSVSKYDKFVKLNDAAMATSGDYRNFYEVDGKVYSHTIDPKTGAPVTHQLASVSVLAGDCMSADAYATAGLVLGPEGCQKLFERLNLGYFLMERKGDAYGEFVGGGLTVVDIPEDSTSGKVASKTSIVPMFVGAAVIFGLAILGMACGAIFNNKPITGSCGGLSAANGGSSDTSCSICHKPTADCPDLEEKPASSKA